MLSWDDIDVLEDRFRQRGPIGTLTKAVTNEVTASTDCSSLPKTLSQHITIVEQRPLMST
jgi:hypothetical protein